MKSPTIKNKIIVILGPTANGKSEMAVKIARKFNGEIISADSRQVYKRLNIGSGKITQKEMRGIKHHCLDISSPKKIYTAFDFKKCAEKAIEDILSRGKTPIICGGTGFYIDVALSKTQLAEVPPNWKLRKKLERKSAKELFKMIKKLNSERAKNIDKHNSRRLIRAIEIAKDLGKVSKMNYESGIRNYEFLQIGLKLQEKELERRIEKRVRKMIKDGLINEVKKLKKQWLSWKRFYELGFEYKYPAMFLQSKISKHAMLEKMLSENRQYAKRQMTWFRKDKQIKWIDDPKKAWGLVKKFISC